MVGSSTKNCLSFKVKNVTLVETLETEAGFGPGYNNIFGYFGQVPRDNPSSFSIYRIMLFQMRFVNGKKDPNWAEVPLNDSDFLPIEER